MSPARSFPRPCASDKPERGGNSVRQLVGDRLESPGPREKISISGRPASPVEPTVGINTKNIGPRLGTSCVVHFFFGFTAAPACSLYHYKGREAHPATPTTCSCTKAPGLEKSQPLDPDIEVCGSQETPSREANQEASNLSLFPSILHVAAPARFRKCKRDVCAPQTLAVSYVDSPPLRVVGKGLSWVGINTTLAAALVGREGRLETPRVPIAPLSFF